MEMSQTAMSAPGILAFLALIGELLNYTSKTGFGYNTTLQLGFRNVRVRRTSQGLCLCITF